MDTIKALINVKKNLEKRRSDYKYSQKLDEFEALLNENESLDDHQACLQIYGNKNITPAYKSLKYRMEEKLMNDVFTICALEEDLSSSIMSSIQIEKISLVSLLLLKSHYRRESVILFEKVLKLSKKLYFPDITIKQLTVLLNHYGFVEPDKARMMKILNEMDYYSEMHTAELYVRKANAIISHMYVMNKGGFSQKQLRTINEYVTESIKIKERFKTNTIVAYANDLAFFYYQTIGDFERGLEIATKSLNEMSIFSTQEIYGIYQSKKNIAIANFFLKDYSESSKWFEEVFKMVTIGTRNWFNLTGLFFLNLINAREYEKLYILSYDVLTNKNLKKFPIFEEQWYLREAYLHFLIRMEKIDPQVLKERPMKPFSLNKFLNSVPFHSKDKSGQNITILVIQILFLILDSKYNKIIDKIDTLTQYTYRYLNKDDTFRSNCFIKMLLQMVKADLHPIRTKTYTETLRKKLENSHLIIDERSAQVEIIPYDFLWDMIIELLEIKNK
ncbi:MAG TPA: hypothetical protein PLE29_09840 [Saprospiraceae bacterium]|nr:hypothetical protein [Saprospiraceae bacterium]HQV97955.1 hypothetical protein [Saprospiraceae bacterium]